MKPGPGKPDVRNFKGDTGNVTHGERASVLRDPWLLPRLDGSDFGTCHIQKRKGSNP